MCILLKLNYAKFGFSKLSFSKIIEEKPLGDRADPLVKEGLMTMLIEIHIFHLPRDYDTVEPRLRKYQMSLQNFSQVKTRLLNMT